MARPIFAREMFTKLYFIQRLRDVIIKQKQGREWRHIDLLRTDWLHRQWHHKLGRLRFTRTARTSRSLVTTLLSVCLSVCLFTRITRKTHGRTLSNFRACCPQPWLDPLWRASRYVTHFRFCGWRHIFIPRPESSMMLCLEEIRQVEVPAGRRTTAAFGRVCQNAAAPWAKSVIYDWLVCKRDQFILCTKCSLP